MAKNSEVLFKPRFELGPALEGFLGKGVVGQVPEEQRVLRHIEKFRGDGVGERECSDPEGATFVGGLDGDGLAGGIYWKKRNKRVTSEDSGSKCHARMGTKNVNSKQLSIV